MQSSDEPEGADAPVRTAIKRALMHLYCHGLLPRRAVRAAFIVLRLEHL